MVAPRQLAHPPITEAIVDLRFLSADRVTADQLHALYAEWKDFFSQSVDQKQFKAELRVEAGKLMPPSARDLGFHGVLMSSADGTKRAQVRPDGFSFNNVGLGAYMGGDALLNEALRLWSQFSETARPTTVTRLALRYLNRLELPLRDGDEFTRYLTASPELPAGAPQKVSSFLSRVVAHDETGATAVVTQKLDRANPTTVPVIIDIDVFFTEELSPLAEDLRPRLELLREAKNRVFFALITEETAKLYR